MRGINLFFTFGIFVLAGSFSAGCISDAYAKACASCPFDEYGKMDSSCYEGYKASGIGCLSTTYPIVSAKYARGECQQINGCLSQLESCKASYSTGNDEADCREGSVRSCFSAADACIKNVAFQCGKVEEPCRGSLLGMLILLVLAGIAKYRKI